jgi:hypothetical protein
MATLIFGSLEVVEIVYYILFILKSFVLVVPYANGVVVGTGFMIGEMELSVKNASEHTAGQP